MEFVNISKLENFGQFVRVNSYFKLRPPYSFLSEYINVVSRIENCKTALSFVEGANCHPISNPRVIIGAVVKEAEDEAITVGISFELPKGYDNTPKLLTLYNSLEERVQVMARAMNPLYPPVYPPVSPIDVYPPVPPIDVYPPVPPIDLSRIECITLSSVLDSRSLVSMRFRGSKRRGSWRGREDALGLRRGARFKRTNRI